MLLRVIRATCLKSGQCTYLHPELFREDRDGYPEVLQPRPGEDLLPAVEEAAEVCPSQSIVLDPTDNRG